MTPDKTPSDAEIAALYAEETGFELNASPAALLDFARAVLAKWGSPVVAGEPEGWITWCPTAAGVRDPIYSHGPKKPSHGPELDAVLRKYPVFTTPQPTQAQADGFFLLLPQRPKPEAPAGTVGLDWDAYSGAQMLAFGRDSSDAAIAALRTEQPAPATQQAGERVYAFRRKGLADFCTCDEARYEELSNKPHLFETRIFYTTPQPTQAQSVPLTDEWIRSRCKESWIFDTTKQWVRMTESAHGITHKEGGQHDTDT